MLFMTNTIEKDIFLFALGNKVKPQKMQQIQCILVSSRKKILNLIHNNSSERVYKSRSICGYIISPCVLAYQSHICLFQWY